jgi:hypothetical protein
MPRNAQGKFVLNPAAARKIRFQSKLRKAVRAKRASAGLKAAVKSVLSRQLETKYVAEDTVGNTLVPAGTTTPANLFRMIPNVAVGAGDFNRIGDRIKPTRATCAWAIHYNAANTEFQDVTVHLVILTVKGATTAAAVAQVPPTNLLKIGNGGFCDPDQAVFSQTQLMEHVNNYPINDSLYTVKKHFRKRFAKGSYDINGAPGVNATSQIAVAQPLHVFRWSWTPPTLKYNSNAVTLPTNHYPVYAIWCTTNDGTAYPGLLSYGTRCELSFKDA